MTASKIRGKSSENICTVSGSGTWSITECEHVPALPAFFWATAAARTGNARAADGSGSRHGGMLRRGQSHHKDPNRHCAHCSPASSPHGARNGCRTTGWAVRVFVEYHNMSLGVGWDIKEGVLVWWWRMWWFGLYHHYTTFNILSHIGTCLGTHHYCNRASIGNFISGQYHIASNILKDSHWFYHITHSNTQQTCVPHQDSSTRPPEPRLSYSASRGVP